jgi:hypothetical protein
MILQVYGSIIVKDYEDTYFLLIPLYNGSINNCIYVHLDKIDKEAINEFITKFNEYDNEGKIDLLLNGVENFTPIDSYYISESLANQLTDSIEDELPIEPSDDENNNIEEYIDNKIDSLANEINENNEVVSEALNQLNDRINHLESSDEYEEEEEEIEEPEEDDEEPIIDEPTGEEPTGEEPIEDEESLEEEITLDDITYPDYLIMDADGIRINDYWQPILNNENINNIDYLIFKNKLKDNVFTEEELLALNSTFMQTIQRYSTFTDFNLGTNAIYKAVIDFYANGQYDAATVLMNTIFNGTISTTTVTSTCGCGTQSTCATTISSGSTGINTGTEIIPIDTASCIDKYKAAMYQWLIQMLSDTSFYCCWMFTENEELDESNPNTLLIDMLIELLEEFLTLGIDLSNLGSSSTTSCNCGHSIKYNGYKNNSNDCSDLLNNNINGGLNNCSNYGIISNYIKVLKWVRNNEIEENKNKIYIYGKQFAEIFPLLNF